MNNLDKMGKLLETCNVLKINQEESGNMNRQFTPNEIEEVIKLQINKSPGPDGFTGEFHLSFQEELTPLLLTLVHKIQDKGKIPSSFIMPALS